MPKVKVILPSAALLVSALFSFLFALGAFVGFLGTQLFQRKAPGGKVQLRLGLGKRQIHFHHWIMASLFVLVIALMGLLSFFPKFCLGGAVGIICHDFLTDKEWYRVLVRK